jgi:hypothetical protein
MPRVVIDPAVPDRASLDNERQAPGHQAGALQNQSAHKGRKKRPPLLNARSPELLSEEKPACDHCVKFHRGYSC